MTKQSDEIAILKAENEKLKQDLQQLKPEPPESVQVSEGTWRYPTLGIRVSAGCKEDADQKAIAFLPTHEQHPKEREELEAKETRTEEEERRLEKLRKLQ